MTTDVPAQLALFEGTVMEEAVLALAGRVILRPNDDLLGALRLGRRVLVTVEVGDVRFQMDADVTQRVFGYRSSKEGRIPVTRTRITLAEDDDA